jgi:hypothetical protein
VRPAALVHKRFVEADSAPLDENYKKTDSTRLSHEAPLTRQHAVDGTRQTIKNNEGT